MAGRWHKKIVNILKELCQEWVDSGLYKKYYDGNSDPIPITYKKSTYYYQPDLYAIYNRTGKVDVYEVIDTESEGEAVMDIVYSALTPRINVLCIVCSDSSKLKAVKKHARIILNKMYDEDKKKYVKIFNPKYFVTVPKEVRSWKRVKEELRNQLFPE